MCDLYIYPPTLQTTEEIFIFLQPCDHWSDQKMEKFPSDIIYRKQGRGIFPWLWQAGGNHGFFFLIQVTDLRFGSCTLFLFLSSGAHHLSPEGFFTLLWTLSLNSVNLLFSRVDLIYRSKGYIQSIKNMIPHVFHARPQGHPPHRYSYCTAFSPRKYIYNLRFVTSDLRPAAWLATRPEDLGIDRLVRSIGHVTGGGARGR